MQIPVFVQTAGLLVLSNIFMTFAWHGHHQPFKLDYVWAAPCLVGAVDFIFRS